MKQYNKNKMNAKNFDIIMYTNADGLGSGCIAHAHRLPFIKGIAKAMEGTGKVLVVLRYRSIPQCWFGNNANKRSASSDKSGLNQLSENLWTIRPTVIGNTVLASYFKPMRWNLLRQQRKNINQAAALLDMDNKRIAWMTHPYHYLYRGCANESAVVYECYDDLTYNRSTGKSSRGTKLLELKLARKAHLNLATVDALYERLRTVNKNTKLIQNGVMFELFSRCRTGCIDVAPQIKNLPRPVVGMIGTLQKGYDFKLINRIIENKPTWSFVYVGDFASSAKSNIARLVTYPQFHMFGWVPREELLKYLSGFDVAIVPFKTNDWSKTINPLKICEYFAAGIPVVATGIDAIYNYKACVDVCHSSHDFIKAIERVLNGESDDKIRKGIQIAKSLSWETITLDIVNELNELV